MEPSVKDKNFALQMKASFDNLKEKLNSGLVSIEQGTIDRKRINDKLMRLLNQDAEALVGIEEKKGRKKMVEICSCHRCPNKYFGRYS